MKRPSPLIALLLWMTAAYAASFIGVQGSLRGIAGLYMTLHKPTWTAPAWLFAPVWTVLYGLIGYSAWRVWRAEAPSRGALTLWWLQLALNALWPWLFFASGRLGVACAECGLLWFSILATILALSRIDRRAAWVLLPYLLWVGYATLLNFSIWRLNS